MSTGDDRTGAATSSYAHGRHEVEKAHADALSGEASGLFLAVSTAPLAPAGATALQKTAESFGYGPDPVTFLDASEVDGGPEALFETVEGIDPMCLVACDDGAVKALSAAYGRDVAPMSVARLAGRDVAAVPDLAGQVATQEGKRRVWALLRTLPHWHEGK